MKIIEDYPPNIELIRAVLNPEPHSIFTFGDTIYNPSKREITPDLEAHEETHSRQQGSNPDGWWSQYLQDKHFRLEEEVEAYSNQFAYTKRSINTLNEKVQAEGKRLAASPSKVIDYALDSMAHALSGASYGYMISFGAARSKIRNCAI